MSEETNEETSLDELLCEWVSFGYDPETGELDRPRFIEAVAEYTSKDDPFRVASACACDGEVSFPAVYCARVFVDPMRLAMFATSEAAIKAYKCFDRRFDLLDHPMDAVYWQLFKVGRTHDGLKPLLSRLEEERWLSRADAVEVAGAAETFALDQPFGYVSFARALNDLGFHFSLPDGWSRS